MSIPVEEDPRYEYIQGDNFCADWWALKDSEGRIIHMTNRKGFEEWKEFDSFGNLLHYKNSDGNEIWYKRDTDGNVVHYKNALGYEEWFEYSPEGEMISSVDSNGYVSYYDEDMMKIEEYNEYGEAVHKDADGNVI